MLDNNVNKDLANQTVKLLNYFYNRYNVDRYATNIDAFTFREEFISIATTYCLNKVYNYDSKRGEFSTFIYMMFNRNFYIWVNMANYGHSYSEARALYKLQKEQKKSNEYESLLYASTPIIPYSYDNVKKKDSEGDSEVPIMDFIADPDIDLEFSSIDKMSYDEVLKFIETTNILSKKQKEYLLVYIKQNLTLQEIADMFNVSKQAVGYSINQASKRLQKAEFIKQCCNRN